MVRVSTKQTFGLAVAVVLYTMLVSIKNSVWFPFCRTLVTCPNSTVLNLTAASNATTWSGSMHCNDLDYVAKTAQVVKSWCDTLNIVFQGIFMPILGRCSDHKGRRIFLVLGACGLLIQLLFCAFAASFEGALSTFFLLSSSAIQGSTSTFIPTSVALVVDLTRGDEKEVGRSLGMLQGIKTFGGLIGAALGIMIISWNVSDYSSIFVSLVVPGLAMALLASCSPETTAHHLSVAIKVDDAPFGGDEDSGDDDGHTSSRYNSNKSACSSIDDFCSPFRLIMQTRALSTIALFSFLFALGAASLTIASAFTITVFHWTQTQASLVIVYPAIIGVISFVLSAWIVPKCGALLSVVLASSLGTLGLISMTLSTVLSSFFFVVGLGFLAAGAFGLVGYLAFISNRIDPARIGELQGTLGSCALFGFALGNVFYSGLFYFVDGQEWLIFGVGTIFSGLALMLIVHYYVFVFGATDTFSVLGGNDNEQDVEEWAGTRQGRRRTSTLQMTTVQP
jgi:MFS family permease